MWMGLKQHVCWTVVLKTLIYESFFSEKDITSTLCSGMAEVDKFLIWAGQMWTLGLTLNFVVLVNHLLFWHWLPDRDKFWSHSELLRVSFWKSEREQSPR